MPLAQIQLIPREDMIKATYARLLSIRPLHTNSGCGKERRILIGPWGPAKAVLVRNYLEAYWPYAGGLSAVVVVFFTLTDRASTIPSIIRGCQSDTWSAGQKEIRGTSTKLQ